MSELATVKKIFAVALTFLSYSFAEGLPKSSERVAGHLAHNLERVGTVGNKTYYWETTANVTWIESLEICHLKGMYMASIETEQEDRFLILAGLRIGWSVYLNIAGTDIFDEGNWRWLRSGRPFNYTNWYPGSPYPDPDGRNWNCLALDPNAPWKWVDMACNTYKCMTLCEV